MSAKRKKTPRKKIYRAARSSGFSRRKSAGFAARYAKKTGRKR